MTTLRPCVQKQRSDGYYPVYIRVTHDRNVVGNHSIKKFDESHSRVSYRVRVTVMVLSMRLVSVLNIDHRDFGGVSSDTFQSLNGKRM